MRIQLLKCLIKWYRRRYFPLDGKVADVQSIGHNLDEVIGLLEDEESNIG